MRCGVLAPQLAARLARRTRSQRPWLRGDMQSSCRWSAHLYALLWSTPNSLRWVSTVGSSLSSAACPA